eukprot:6174516-Prymnesium_polylepis.1
MAGARRDALADRERAGRRGRGRRAADGDVGPQAARAARVAGTRAFPLRYTNDHVGSNHVGRLIFLQVVGGPHAYAHAHAHSHCACACACACSAVRW